MKEQFSPSGDRRSLKDFAHLFVGGGVEKTPTPASPPQPSPAAPNTHPLIAFLSDGNSWFRTFLTAEIAVVLAETRTRLRIAEEAGLFPTISGHLGRWPDKKANPGSIELVPAKKADLPGQTDHDCTLVEIPEHLPAWSQQWLSRADLTVVTITERHVNRIRAFQQLKHLLTRNPDQRTGVILAEDPGSGQGRHAFHRFTSALPRTFTEPIFLGAMPLEPLLDREILPERKPSVIWFPNSITAAAVTRTTAEIRRTLSLEQSTC